MVKIISTTISDDFWNIAKENKIRWCDALARGIKVLSSGESYELDFERQQEKIDKLIDRINELARDNEKLQERLTTLEKS